MSWLRKKLVRYFITGIIAVLPIGITIGILVWLFNVIDGLLQPLITFVYWPPNYRSGFWYQHILIYAAGIVASLNLSVNI
jgi:uncharacterized membrane protein